MDQYNGQAATIVGTLPAVRSISATTNASPIVLTTTAAHGFKQGDYINVFGAQDPAANGVWVAGTVTSTTVVLTGSTGTMVGGAQGSAQNLNFGTTYGMPTDLVDDMDAGSVNVGLEALGDRTSYNLLQLAMLQGQRRYAFSGAGPHAAAWDVRAQSTLFMITDAACAITITFANPTKGRRYVVALDHSHSGNVTITWSGATHRFLDSVDQNPRPGSGYTVWIGTCVEYADTSQEIQWIVAKGNVAADSFRHTGNENNDVRVDGAGNFVMTKSGTVSQLFPIAGTDITVWTTPSAPYLIEGAVIEYTANVTADADPQNIAHTLKINGYPLVDGADSPAGWGGVTYTVSNATTNLCYFATPQDLLDGSVAGNETGDLGAVSSNGQLYVAADGGANGLWNKTLTWTVAPSVQRTITIPYRIRVWGRLLTS